MKKVFYLLILPLNKPLKIYALKLMESYANLILLSYGYPRKFPPFLIFLVIVIIWQKLHHLKLILKFYNNLQKLFKKTLLFIINCVLRGSLFLGLQKSKIGRKIPTLLMNKSRVPIKFGFTVMNFKLIEMGQSLQIKFSIKHPVPS